MTATPRAVPSPAEPWELPATVTVRGGKLLWIPPWAGRHPKRARRWATPDEPGLLDSFVRLANTPDKAIENFAAHWGVLALCVHDLPQRHRVENPPPGLESWDARRAVPEWWRRRGMHARCKLRELQPGCYWEPLETWRRFARDVESILKLAAALHEGSIGDEALWIAASETYCPDLLDRGDRISLRPQSVDEGRLLLSFRVQHWLALGDVRPNFSWGQGAPTFTLGGQCLFGAIAVQLMLTVSGSKGVAVCYGCGTPFTPKRRLVSGENHYCESCGRRVAEQDASRRYRGHKKRAVELFAEGCNPAEIAVRLERDEKTIRRWLGLAPAPGTGKAGRSRRITGRWRR